MINRDTYDALVERHRRELHAHCYRMLASVDDAEDALQETFLRGWRSLDTFGGRSSARTWLYTIATNVCLRSIERRRARSLPAAVEPVSHPQHAIWDERTDWLGPYPTDDPGPEEIAVRHESLELAFLVACQHLPPAQRAVLLLREVLGFAARDVASILDTSVAAVNSSLQRARRSLRTIAPDPTQCATLRSLGDAGIEDLVMAYVDAWERNDIDAVLGLLTADATFEMPPLTVWFSGRAAIEEFLPDGPFRSRWRIIPARANGQLAFGCYAWDETTSAYLAHSLDVISVRGRHIGRITAFLGADLLPRFGLPARLDKRPVQSTVVPS